jgi:hypothetical protein
MKQTYFETLAEGLDAVEKFLVEEKAAEWEPSFRQEYGFGGLGYGETQRSLHPLISHKGKTCFTTRKDGTKRCRKALAISIYRLESGRYEFTVYIA